MRLIRMYRFCIFAMLCITQMPSYATEPVNYARMRDEISLLRHLNLAELMDVPVYSGDRTLKKLRTSTANMVVISDEDIARSGAKMLSDLLWMTAGIQVQVKNNKRHTAWFRGVQTEFNNKVALFIDGMPSRDLFGGFKLDREIPLDNIKRIEIIRGPGSTLYGSNAFSGVISVFTYAPGERPSPNAVTLDIGNAGTYGVYLRGEEELKHAYVQVQGKYYDTDGHIPVYDRNGRANNSENPKQSLSYLQLKAALKAHKLSFNMVLSDFDNLNVNKGIQRPSARDIKRYSFNLHYAQEVSDTLSAQWHLYYTRHDRSERETTYLMTERQRVDVLEDYTYNDNVSLLGLQSIWNYDWHPRHALVAGFQLQHETQLDNTYIDQILRVTNDYATAPNPDYQHLELSNLGVFAQYSYDITPDKTAFTAGLRYDKLDLFSNQISYRLGLTHRFNTYFSAKLLYGTAFRSPNFLEFTRANINTPLPDVETVNTLEAQLNYTTSHYSLSLSVFHNEYEDVIQRLQGEQFGNVGGQDIYGSELETRLNLSQHWSGFANFSALQAEDKETGEALPLFADWTATVGLDWQYQHAEHRWSVHNHLVTYGDRHDWPSSTWNPGQQARYDHRSADLADGFSIWYASVRYQILHGTYKGLELALSIHNVLNETYYTQVSSTPNANRIAYFDTQYEPRQYDLSLSYHW